MILTLWLEAVPTDPIATPSSTAGIITACASIALLITAATGLITAISKLGGIKRTTQHIHHLVNGERTAMQKHIRDLHKTLADNNLPIPEYPPEIMQPPA